MNLSLDDLPLGRQDVVLLKFQYAKTLFSLNFKKLELTFQYAKAFLALIFKKPKPTGNNAPNVVWCVGGGERQLMFSARARRGPFPRRGVSLRHSCIYRED